MARVVEGVVKGVSAGIGLAVEKYYDQKERKSIIAVQEQSPRPQRPTSSQTLGVIDNDNDKEDALWVV